METYGGNGAVASHMLMFGFVWMSVTSFTPWSLYPLQKGPPVPIEWENVRTMGTGLMLWRKENFPPPVNRTTIHRFSAPYKRGGDRDNCDNDVEKKGEGRVVNY